MATLRANIENTASPASVALIGIVRLLARQAAREWTERLPDADHPARPSPRSEKRP
jgi:hypothetical protein